MDTDFDLESLVNVEQTFYDEGYQNGFSHGRIHGLIEGRALGREKGFEMWEELGFYEGFAKTWMAVLVKQGKSDERASQHIRYLLDTISHFPRVNPSASEPASEELDIPKLLRQIRSRYKVLCSSLGVRPRLQSAEVAAMEDKEEDDTRMEEDEVRTPTRGTLGSAIPVWKIDKNGMKKPVTNQDLSF
ncbi:hypothetical protein M413DRAFT_449638 [Hebeloma cylindrosporum]|uniref:Essential protein Yae1 N-terminal domain-containing protein n=1 Tax=Hebeloma cylindrosporum TaxID=76867 RepID=A0A0C2XCF7_HEBCY|nr:hypothetical protein M413DRAFT_449638 [Hebeloma cylindrosporum h7]